MRFPVALALVFFLSAPLGAQTTDGPHRDWRTLRTEHFVVHYPPEQSPWVAAAAPRMESIYRAVEGIVKRAPESPITLVVDEPDGQGRGFSSNNVRRPVVFIGPYPWGPRSNMYADRAEIRFIHELTHSLHATVPDPSRKWRAAFRLLPGEVSPLRRKAAARGQWFLEGYAVHVEGALSGGGRPYSAWRARQLRIQAMDGRLPQYKELQKLSEAAYLAGSAFLEWLMERKGPEAPVLFSRALSRPENDFERAFVEAFGMPPARLYAAFTEEQKAKAGELRAALEAEGLHEGERLLSLKGETGPPDLSRDGGRLVAVTRTRLPRVKVWRTGEWARPIASLGFRGGSPHDHARFLGDGREVLVTRFERTGPGEGARDLFVWDVERDRLRRITRGAGLAEPAPTPDGRAAVAIRCRAGNCDLVVVDLATGALRTLVPGTPERAFFNPRISPDGRTVAAVEQSGRRCRIVLVELATGARRYADPEDGVRRYEPSFLPAGDRLAVVSEAGGIPNLEVLELSTGQVRPLTRVLTASYAPVAHPTDGSVLYLRAHAQGLDLYRVDAASLPAAGGSTVRGATLAPLIPPSPPPAPAFDPSAPGDPRPYGIGGGTRQKGLLPSLEWTTDGPGLGAWLWSSDPVGRLDLALKGMAGSASTWRGVGATALWRRRRPSVRADLFALEQAADALPSARYLGTQVTLHRRWERNTQRHDAGAVGSWGWLREGGQGRLVRRFVGVELSRTDIRVGDRWYLATEGRLGLALGQTGEAGWRRGVAELAFLVGQTAGPAWLRMDAATGRVSEGGPAFEHFAVGGPATSLADEALLSQRRPLAALASGALRGRTFWTAKAAVPRYSLRPFAWIGSTEGRPSPAKLLGMEWAGFEWQPHRGWGVPGGSLTAGATYALGDPPGRRWGAFVRLAYTH